MLNVEQVDEWRGQDVLDQDGEKIGKLDEVFYDASTGQPAFVSVRSGLLGRKSHIVALAGATVSREYLRVAYTGDQVDTVDVEEVDGQLDLDGVRRAAVTYGVTIDPDARFESATLLSQRREQVDQARTHAEELEAEAAHKAQEAEVHHGRAADAAALAQETEQERQAAEQAAHAARIEAERAARDLPNRPAD